MVCLCSNYPGLVNFLLSGIQNIPSRGEFEPHRNAPVLGRPVVTCLCYKDPFGILSLWKRIQGREFRGNASHPATSWRASITAARAFSP